MKIANNTWNNSIFRRLLITFILIMIPIYFFGLFIYNWGIHAVREEISNSMESQVSSYLSNLDAEIKRIQSSQYDCLGDENLYTLAAISGSMNEYERSRAVLRLQQRLVAIKNSSIYIKNVTAYIPTIGISVSAFLAQEEITDEFHQVIAAASANLDSIINYWDGRLFMTEKYPGSILNKTTPLMYAVVVELSNNGISNALTQLDNKSNGIILMDLGLKFTITGNGENEINQKVRNEMAARHGNEMAGNFSVNIQKKKYMVISKKSDYLNLVLSKSIPEDEIFAKVEKYQNWFWYYTIITMIIILVFCVSTYKFIHKPLVKLVKSFKKIENGELNIQIKHSHQDEFGYLFKRFNVMVDYLNALIDQVYKQKIMTQRAELKQLQSQINPHFLYNSFFILYSMVESEDYETVKLFTKQLGNYFQFITRSSTSEVPLHREVAHARTYSLLQAKRFRSRLNVEFDDLPEACKDLYVPRLILQPIIENAFEHGLENKIENGLLLIQFQATESCLYIRIEDNGESISQDQVDEVMKRISNPEEDTEDTGMINIHKRLQLMFGEKSGLEVSIGDLGGLKVTVKIELKEEEPYV